MKLVQSIALVLLLLSSAGWLFLTVLIAIRDRAPRRRKVDLDAMVNSPRTIMIDGKEQKVLVTSQKLTEDELQVLREKWKALHKGDAQ